MNLQRLVVALTAGECDPTDEAAAEHIVVREVGAALEGGDPPVDPPPEDPEPLDLETVGEVEDPGSSGRCPVGE